MISLNFFNQKNIIILYQKKFKGYKLLTITSINDNNMTLLIGFVCFKDE